MAEIIKRSEEILDILRQACARRELLILATPYLRFESAFLAIRDGELHIQATMSRDDAVYGLRGPALKIRFPDGLGFMEGTVEMLGLGLLEGRRTLRLALPKALQENDQRESYRVERVGRVLATYSTGRGDLDQGSLVDISVTGARLHAQRDLDPARLGPGTVMALSIPLSQEIQIETQAEVRHVGARTLGVAFRPALPVDVETPLSRWVFQRREEERDRIVLRMELNGRRAQNAPQGPPPVLLVGSDGELEAAIREFIVPIQPLHRIPGSIQALRDALAQGPPLVIFHVASAGLDERRRLRTLVECTQGKAPALLLGTQVDGAVLFDLAGDWKAATAMVWNPARGMFLQRLVQGIIRRTTHGGESPMAPPEA